ncbi:MAG TPA: hypothetical protein VFS88_05765 [Micavibrio sp.]|nr:hypothetical protein [Micavibrio sp.]
MPSNEFLHSAQGARELRKVLADNFEKFAGLWENMKLHAIDHVVAHNENGGKGITGRAMVMVDVSESGLFFAEKQPGGPLCVYADFGLSPDMSKVTHFRHNLMEEALIP